MSGVCREKEYIVCCPECKAFETLLFIGDMLVPTKKFTQNGDGKVYHDCGSSLPCKAFPEFIEGRVDMDKVKHRSHVSDKRFIHTKMGKQMVERLAQRAEEENRLLTGKLLKQGRE